MFEVKDNFLPEKEYINIYTLLADEYFPWYFNNYKTVPHTKELFDYQFTHIFYKDNEILSPFFKGLKPLIDKLNSRTLVRIKANLNPITQESAYPVFLSFLITFPDQTERKTKSSPVQKK